MENKNNPNDKSKRILHKIIISLFFIFFLFCTILEIYFLLLGFISIKLGIILLPLSILLLKYFHKKNKLILGKNFDNLEAAFATFGALLLVWGCDILLISFFFDLSFIKLLKFNSEEWKILIDSMFYSEYLFKKAHMLGTIMLLIFTIFLIRNFILRYLRAFIVNVLNDKNTFKNLET